MENRKRVCNFNKNMKSKRRRLADKFYKEVYQDSSDNENCFISTSEGNESTINEEVFFDAVDEFKRNYWGQENLNDLKNPEDVTTDGNIREFHDEFDDEFDDAFDMEGIVEETDDEENSSILQDEREQDLMLNHLNDNNYFAPEYDKLRLWAVSKKICQNHLDELLNILRPRLLPYLPRSSKTFLKTASTRYTITSIEDEDSTMGHYAYFGIEKGLKECINIDEYKSDEIHLIMNADGLPLFKSSPGEFWPILCRVYYEPDVYDPFPVLIYHGNSKPKDLELYLDQFITELNHLLSEGILINGKHFKVNVKCFTCDTPARAYLKSTKGHTGYSACERCDVKGERNANRVTYSDINCEERSDVSFRNQKDPEHHHGKSPLEKITPKINMVLIFVLDIMHLLFLGVMKKLLLLWIKGTDLNFRIGRIEREELNRRMNYIKSQVPCEFQRKPRSTKFLSFWKATEFRFFLLYCGPIVLRKILKNVNFLNHFLLLHVACRILCTRNICVWYNECAKKYLRSFFAACKELYGPACQIINMHNLIHVADDAVNMNCELSSVSCFPFENLLGKMKSLLRSANRPLAQVCRRLHENMIANKQKTKIALITSILEEKNDQITVLKHNQSTLTVKSPNNIVILKDNKIFEIQKMYRFSEKIQLEGKKWKVKSSIFEYPCDSAELKMWELEPKPSENTYTCSIDNVSSKSVKINLNFKPEESEKVFVMPLLHCVE